MIGIVSELNVQVVDDLLPVIPERIAVPSIPQSMQELMRQDGHFGANRLTRNFKPAGIPGATRGVRSVTTREEVGGAKYDDPSAQICGLVSRVVSHGICYAIYALRQIGRKRPFRGPLFDVQADPEVGPGLRLDRARDPVLSAPTHPDDVKDDAQKKHGGSKCLGYHTYIVTQRTESRNRRTVVPGYIVPHRRKDR